jgi:hypothetical protein
MGWSVALIYSMIEKINHCALLKRRRQIGFGKKKTCTVRSFARAVLVNDAVQIHFRLCPAVRMAVEGGGVPRQTRRDAMQRNRNEDGSAQGISYRDRTRGHCRGHAPYGVEARQALDKRVLARVRD